MAHNAYSKAECVCASLERQLREAHQQLMTKYLNQSQSLSSITSNGSSTNNGDNDDPVRVIDYEYYPDLEPSPVLRSLLSTSNTSGGINLLSSPSNLFSPSTASSNSLMSASASIATFDANNNNNSGTQQNSMAKMGRTARVGLGRPVQASLGKNNSTDFNNNTNSTATLSQFIHHPQSQNNKGSDSNSSIYPSPSIASTVSLFPSSQPSMAQLHSSTSTLSSDGGMSSSSASSSTATINIPRHHQSSTNSLRSFQSQSNAHLEKNQTTASTTSTTNQQQGSGSTSNQNSFANLPINVRPNGK